MSWCRTDNTYNWRSQQTLWTHVRHARSKLCWFSLSTFVSKSVSKTFIKHCKGTELSARAVKSRLKQVDSSSTGARNIQVGRPHVKMGRPYIYFLDILNFGGPLPAPLVCWLGGFQGQMSTASSMYACQISSGWYNYVVLETNEKSESEKNLKSVNILQSYKEKRDCLVHFLCLSSVLARCEKCMRQPHSC